MPRLDILLIHTDQQRFDTILDAASVSPPKGHPLVGRPLHEILDSRDRTIAYHHEELFAEVDRRHLTETQPCKPRAK